MDSSVSPKDEICLLRVWRYISKAVSDPIGHLQGGYLQKNTSTALCSAVVCTSTPNKCVLLPLDENDSNDTRLSVCKQTITKRRTMPVITLHCIFSGVPSPLCV